MGLIESLENNSVLTTTKVDGPTLLLVKTFNLSRSKVQSLVAFLDLALSVIITVYTIPKNAICTLSIVGNGRERECIELIIKGVLRQQNLDYRRIRL